MESGRGEGPPPEPPCPQRLGTGVHLRGQRASPRPSPPGAEAKVRPWARGILPRFSSCPTPHPTATREAVTPPRSPPPPGYL